MDRDFWLERWDQGQIGFHQALVNPLLARYWPDLEVSTQAGVFVPLCGKSLDMRYLRDRGHRVVGVELSERAIQAYFAEAGETAVKESGFYLQQYRGERTVIHCGDLFDLQGSDLQGVRGVYDRGALVALPATMRRRYADHLQRILPDRTVTLLITLEYDQALIDGPPFAVSESEVQALFGDRGSVTRLARHRAVDLPPRFGKAGVSEAREVVYRLEKTV
ncbi:MAG: thiopurine S-methyltransferase [Pseudomonadales bacterium]